MHGQQNIKKILYMFLPTLCSSSGGQIVLIILSKWPSGAQV